MKNKVYLGFSGGVDSSVAAHLLKQQEYDVTGIFMTNVSPDTYAGQCMSEELENAKKVAKQLNIPLLVKDLTGIFKTVIEEHFYNEYLNGNTPNPCIECNKLIKFGELAEYCFDEGADYFATGHYTKTKDGKLFKSKDESKDQTYFLNQLNKEILEKTIFPLQDLTKEEVRKIAKELDLENSEKKDSQKICFLKGKKISEIFDNKQGDIVDIDTGDTVGTHNGIFNYTIGQRHGVKIGGLDQPYFVAKKDLDTNTLYVAQGRENPALWKKHFVIKDFNLINNPGNSEDIRGVIRYHSKETPVTVQWSEDNDNTTKGNQLKGEFFFETPQWAPSTGQSLVLYQDDECLGGGVITEIIE